MISNDLLLKFRRHAFKEGVLETMKFLNEMEVAFNASAVLRMQEEFLENSQDYQPEK